MGRPSTANAGRQDESLWSKLPFVGKKDDTPVPYPDPAQMAATWSPDTLTQTGRVPTRGFGGRLFFFDEKTHAVPVDGTLVVHGFDETATDEKDRVKRFEFTPEQFTGHFSQSDLGASYSVWLPWDAIGGEQKKISLVASFVTAEGKTIQSSPSVVLLPGSKMDTAESLANRYSPEYKAWKLAADSGRARSSGLTTTTIARSRPASRSIEKRPETTSPKMLASAGATPSAEVTRKTQRLPSPTGSNGVIMPASATLPSKR